MNKSASRGTDHVQQAPKPREIQEKYYVLK